MSGVAQPVYDRHCRSRCFFIPGGTRLAMSVRSRGIKNTLSEVSEVILEVFRFNHLLKIGVLFMPAGFLVLGGYIGHSVVFAVSNLIAIGIFAYLLNTISGEDTDSPDMLDLRGQESDNKG